MRALSSHGILQSSASLCRRCLRARARASPDVSLRIGHRSVSQLAMRKVRQAQLQRKEILAKYQSKLIQAEEVWAKKAERIKQGKEHNIWDLFEERGYVKDVAGSRDTIKELLRTRRIGAYVGVDPTAPSLHIGHLLPMMPLFWMYMHGYTAVSLIGGATAKIGDPTGRLQSREAMSMSVVAANMAKIHYQIKKIWVNVDRQAIRYGYEKDWAWKRALENNSVWWNKQSWLEVLQRVGTAMRIGPMLGRDTVKTKMTQGDGVSFAEFCYPVMQGWDWWMLLKRRNVRMQIGGSDQFGNIISGIDVVKAARDSEPNPTARLPSEPMDDPVGFTVPLLTDKSGVKFGKSAGNAVWLDGVDTPVFDLYGYFMRRPDDEVEKLLKLFTFVPLDKITQVMEEQNNDPAKRVAQHLLASEVCTLIHGEAATLQAQLEHVGRYGKTGDIVGYIAKIRGPVPVDVSRPQEDEYQADVTHPVTLNNAPKTDMILPRSLILGNSIPRILLAARLTESIQEGKRGATKKGIYIGAAPGRRLDDKKGMSTGQLQYTPIEVWTAQNTSHYLIDGELLILRKGKHNVRIIRMVSDEEYKASGETYPGQHFGITKTRELEGARQELLNMAKNAEAGTPDADPQGVDEAKNKIKFAREKSPSGQLTSVARKKQLQKEIKALEDRIAHLAALKSARQGTSDSKE